MPYVSKNLRLCLDAPLNEIIDRLEDMGDAADGAAVYAMCRIVAQGLKPPEGWTWRDLKNARGCFFDAADEFYRRLTAPHEDRAISRNGDVPGLNYEPLPKPKGAA